jgi:hypothetical protein
MAVLIGADTVDLVIREATGTLDGAGMPVYTERVVSKSNCCVTVADGTSVTSGAGVSSTSGGGDTEEGSIAVYTMKAALPVDDDTRGLTGDDAIRFAGRTYELNRSADVKAQLDGQEDHVRVFGTAETVTGRSFEQVRVTPRGARDHTGQPTAGATPAFDVLALAVTPGNSTRRFGVMGDVDEVEFTVALPIEIPIKDNDGITVRGRFGLVRVRAEYNRWADRVVKVVTVESTTGGSR